MSAVVAPPGLEGVAELPPPVKRTPKKRITRFILPVFTLGMIVYLAFPVFVMILYSFNIVANRQVAEFTCCTLSSWRNILAVSELNDALITSIKVAIPAAAAATVLGTFLGLVLGRYSFRGRGATNFIIFLAIAVPEIVLGSSLLSMFVLAKVSTGYATIILSHIGFSIAFVAVTVRARVQGLDRNLEDAAQDLFASPISAFFKVTLPLIAPAILAGFLLAFVLSLDDFVITNFVAGPVLTFPLWVYGAQRIGVPPQVNVMGTLLFAAGILAAVASVLAQRRRRRA